MDEICSSVNNYYKIQNDGTIDLFWDMLPIVFQYDAYKTDMPVVTNDEFKTFLSSK